MDEKNKGWDRFKFQKRSWKYYVIKVWEPAILGVLAYLAIKYMGN